MAYVLQSVTLKLYKKGEFIEKVDPQLAVISVGEKNIYGHPDKEVLETCTQLFLPIHRTDLSGTLVYKC